MKEKIIQMTYEQFSAKGYSATLSEIAKVSGLKKQSLYNYFDSKEDLFLEMIKIKVREHYNEQIINMDSYKNLDTIDQLENIFKAFIVSFEDSEKLKFWKRLLIIENSSLLKETKNIIIRTEYTFSEKLREVLLEILKTRPELKEYQKPIVLSYASLICGVLDGYLLFGAGENFNKYIEDVWDFFAHGFQSYVRSDINNKELEGK